MKKRSVIGVILVLIILITLINGCNSNNESPINNGSNQNIFTITGEGYFNSKECSNKLFKDKVIMLKSEYCPHCEKTQPLFEEACQEKGITPLILDISISEQRKQIENFGLNIQYTPTFVFGCKYYVESMSKDKYLELLEVFLLENE